MNQQSITTVESAQPQVPVQALATKKRLPAPILLGRLKAERIEQPLAAVKVMEAMAGLPGWGLSPKAIHLTRIFYFPSDNEARAYMDFLLHLSHGLKIEPKVTIDRDRVHVTLRGLRGGMPSYLLDFAALLSQ